MAAAAVVPFVTVDEYLHTAYSPDVDYVDGQIEERNLGEFDHFLVQRALFFALTPGEANGGYFVAQELRVQISPTRFRVPDTCLLPAGNLPKDIVHDAPLLCIEVMSPGDRFTRTLRTCQDYLGMGVPVVWVLEPLERIAYVIESGKEPREVRAGSLVLDALKIEVSLEAVFARP